MNERQRRRKHERHVHASTRGTGTVTMHVESTLPADASVILHKPDCPAGHPQVDRALQAAYA
jgi:hypothetical protein